MRKALTIGELLITMTIIGVIAALVLPGIIQDYHKKVYTSKLKKTIETIEGAVHQACLDNNVSYFYQTPYAQFVMGGGNQQAFIDKYFPISANVNANPFASSYRYISGGDAGKPSALNSGYAKLTSGQAISFFCKSDRRCIFRIDLNSTEGPNIVGRDLFSVRIDEKTNKLYDEESSDKCGTKSQGEGCLNKLLEDNWTMNY